MSKPKASLRRPDPRVAAFVEGGASPRAPEALPQDPPSPDAPASPSEVRLAPDGKDVRTSGANARRKGGEGKTSTTSGEPDSVATPMRWRRTVELKADGTKQKRLTVRLPEELAAQLAQHCDEHGRSMSDVIADLVATKLTSDV